MNLEARETVITFAGEDGRKEFSSFDKELESLLNHYSIESGSNTPDFILAEYLRQCLSAWNLAVAAREQWYGRKFVPGTIKL